MSRQITGYAAAFDTYHRLGWHVLPFDAGTKWPPPKGYTGRNGAVPSYADMQAWSEDKPDANVAIRLPRTVIGIDVDDYDGKNGAATLAEAESRWGKLPISYRSTSRSDGASGIRLYRIPEGVELRESVGPGIEICQFHHRYVMCWPSTNPDAGGAQYRWYAEIDGSVMEHPPALADIPELPARWLEELTEPEHNGTELPPEGAVDVRACLTEGEPSQCVSFKLGQALTDLYSGKCRHDEILRWVLGLLRKGKNGEPGVKLALNALCEAFAFAVGPDRAGGRAEAIGEFNRMVTGERVSLMLADPEYDDEPKGETNGAAGDESLLAGLKSAAELDAMTFAPLVEHVPGLIVEGFGILAGSPKVGKSWLVVAVALACAQGGIALNGIRVKPRHVLLLALEDGDRRLQSRMRRVNGDQPLPAKLTYLTKVAPGTVAATISEWLKLHRRDENPPLVILDTLGKARPQRKAGEDAYIADYQVGTWIKDTVDAVPGAALLAIHHTRKSGAEDWLDTLSGTQGIAGSADYVLVLTRKRKSDEGLLAVTGRDILEDEYALRVDNGLWRIDGSDLHVAAGKAEKRREEGQLGDRALEVLAFVNSRDTTKAVDVVEQISEMDTEYARKCLYRLAESGRIMKYGRGV